MNIDAAFFDDGTGAIGVVVRNDRGEAVAGCAEKIYNLPSPATAVAGTLEQGLALIENLGCSSVIVESDSMELVQLCNGETEVLTPYATVMVECFAIAQQIDNITVQHCPRNTNKR